MWAAFVPRVAPALLSILLVGAPALAQDSKTEALAGQVGAALETAKLQNFAMKDPSAEGRYIAALYFPGLQLILVSAEYQAPTLLDDRIAKSEFRDAYADLSSASSPATRIVITDIGVNGLRIRPDRDQPADSYEAAGKRTMFDSEWRDQGLMEQEYDKIYADTDASYATMLTAMLAELKARK